MHREGKSAILVTSAQNWRHKSTCSTQQCGTKACEGQIASCRSPVAEPRVQRKCSDTHDAVSTHVGRQRLQSTQECAITRACEEVQQCTWRCVYTIWQTGTAEALESAPSCVPARALCAHLPVPARGGGGCRLPMRPVAELHRARGRARRTGRAS